MVTEMRKTRFVCVSDTHNGTADGSFKLPKGDVLIHAGDLTNQGTFTELQKAVRWIEEADFESKIVIAGNHDITLDRSFYSEYGLYFHNQNPQDPHKCRELFEKSPSILYLNHEAAEVKLSSPTGPHTRFKVFGSPFSPAYGLWAFGYRHEEADHIWNKMPLDADIVVTHGPSKYHCDETHDRRAAGCEALRCMLWRVRPRLAICGHIHEGRGAEIVKWDLQMSNIKYKEAGVEPWNDPGKDNKKVSIIDLTEKGGRMLSNDGSVGSGSSDVAQGGDSAENPRPNTAESKKTKRSPMSIMTSENIAFPIFTNPRASNTLEIGLACVAGSLLAVPMESFPPATQGQGGMPPSYRRDYEALAGRMGRKETCIINAAMMASSWPHKQNGGKRFNKPIVVDIDLPIRTEQ